MWFEAIFDLRINLSKSKIILVGMVDNVEELAFKLGNKVGSLPSLYLDLPLRAPHNSIRVCDSIKERFQKIKPLRRGYTSPKVEESP